MKNYITTIFRSWALAGMVFCMCLPAAAAVQAGEILVGDDPASDQAGFGVMPIQIYQRFISAVNGHRCPMTPSCSQYGVEAFKKHGYLRGWILTSDRLLRCGRDETRLSQIRRKEGRYYSYDPIKNNDFWWFNGVP